MERSPRGNAIPCRHRKVPASDTGFKSNITLFKSINESLTYFCNTVDLEINWGPKQFIWLKETEKLTLGRRLIPITPLRKKKKKNVTECRRVVASTRQSHIVPVTPGKAGTVTGQRLTESEAEPSQGKTAKSSPGSVRPTQEGQ